METSTLIKTVTSIWDQLVAAPAHLLVLLVLLLLGVMIKISPIPNRWIPLILMGTGSTLYPSIVSPGNVDYTLSNPWLVLAIYGWILSIGSIVLHMTLRKMKWFSELEAGIINQFSSKPDQPQPNQDQNESEPKS